MQPVSSKSIAGKDTGLFRSEAIETSIGQTLGVPTGRMPIGWTVIAVFLVTMTLSLVVFLTTGHYARKEAAPGVLRAVGGETRIASQAGGLIRALYVTEGQLVRRGQPLALIGTEQLLPGGGALDEDILASVETEASTLVVRLESLEATAPLEITTLMSERERLMADRDAARAQVEASSARLALARERLETAESLASRGYLAGDQLRQRRSDVIGMEESLASTTEEVRGLGAQISGLDSRIAKAPHDARAAKAQLQAQASQLAQTRSQIAGRRGYELRAPSDGRITALQAGLGQTVDPAKPLMTLTPMTGRLRGELYVPSRAIGFIRPGQRVRLLYDAYPYQKFGPAWGRIVEISATVLGPQEIAAVIQTSEPVYRVVVQMDQQSMQAFGERHPLSPGMAMTADIILEERTFAEWLLEPLFALRGRTQRAPEPAASS